jgi:hypothetical protein
MIIKKVLLTLIFVVVGAILAIYMYDIFNCLYTDSPLPLAELATVLVLLIGTTSVVVVFRKELRSFIQE